MDEEHLCVLSMRDTHIFLDGKEIKGIKGLNLSIGSESELSYGYANLDLQLIVKFPGNVV